MHNTSLKFTNELADALRAKVAAFDFDTIEKIRKAKDDNGTFDVIISTDELDRQGEIVKQEGWDFTNYKRNPVVLWGHDYYSMPVGICTNVTVEGNKTRAQGVFLPESINPFAQQIRRMYDFAKKMGVGVGMQTSVGFIPREFDKSNNRVITKAELLEFSFVPIPANQGVGPADARALTMAEAKEIGLDIFAGVLRSKGIDFIQKESQPGAACQMADGTPGVLGKDPKDPDGPMICIPSGKSEDGSEDEPNANMNSTKAKLMKDIEAEHVRHKAAYSTAVEDLKKAMPEDQGDADDADGEQSKAAKKKKGPEIAKAIDEFRAMLSDEHGMHKSKMIDLFKTFTPPEDKKAFDKSGHLKKLREAHDGYSDKTYKSVDKFSEKMKTVEGAEGEIDSHIGWIVGKIAEHHDEHQSSVMKIASAMCKSAFGETDDTDEKAWWEKASVSEQLAENKDREAKWKRVDAVYEVFGAFINAYLADETPVGDFEKLLDEAVALMKGTETKGVLSEVDRKGKASVVFAVGSKIFPQTTDKLSEAQSILQTAQSVLKELNSHLANGNQKGSTVVKDDKSTAGTGGSKVHQDNAAAELKKHLQTREIVGGIESMAREYLGKIKVEIRAVRGLSIKK
jgi:hypothetical protein